MDEFDDIDIAYYKVLYSFLFNGITDVIEILERGAPKQVVIERLKLLQIEAEEKYISY